MWSHDNDHFEVLHCQNPQGHLCKVSQMLAEREQENCYDTPGLMPFYSLILHEWSMENIF